MSVASVENAHERMSDGPEGLVRHFLACLDRAAHVCEPYDHWLLDDALPPASLDAVAGLPIAPPHSSAFDGTREANNSSRLFFSSDNQARFAICRDIVETFRDRCVIGALERVTGASVSRGRLRIEYCQDVSGFWLAPHVDIAAKLFTMLIYLSGDAALRDAGTDIYDASPEHKPVATVPYEKGKGLIFIPGKDSWHGFTKRKITGVRKSIIVNYVSADWRSVQELA